MRLIEGREDENPDMKSTGGWIVRTRVKSYFLGETRTMMRLVTGVGSCCSVGRRSESWLRRESLHDSSIDSGSLQSVHTCSRGRQPQHQPLTREMRLRL